MKFSIEEKIKQLPDELREEAEDFIDFLIQKKVSKRKKKKKLALKWKGALKEYGTQYTSVELQKKALEWRD